MGAQIKKRQMEALKDNIMGNGSSSAMPTSGMVGFGGGGVTPGYEHNTSTSGYSGSRMGGSASASFGFEKPKAEPEDQGPRVVAKGMKLGGIGGANKKKNNLMAAMAMEDNFSLLGGQSKK